MNGSFLRFYAHEGHRHHHHPGTLAVEIEFIVTDDEAERLLAT